MQHDSTKYQIAQLIYKSIAKIITEEEKVILENWLAHDENRAIYSRIINRDNIQNKLSIYKQIDKESIYKRLEEQMLKSQNRTFKLRNLKVMKYAAIALLLIGMGYIYQSGYFTSDPTFIIPEDSITLQLENGNIEVISENGQTQVIDSEGRIVGTQIKNQLVYSNEIEKEVLEYNTLTVPYGKRFEIQLSDGTNVHLNAGTSLKYPIKFIKGENRQIFIKGEAYFTVAKDTTHAFIVNTNQLDIRVLGTQFNVSSYPEDEHINTVLVEGAVTLYNKNETYNQESASILPTGHLAAWQKSNGRMVITKTDIEMHTAWMKGRLILDEVAFDDILKKLERQYNVTFINNNPSLKNRYFTARFDIEDIHQVMESLSKSAKFNYVFNENQISINP